MSRRLYKSPVLWAFAATLTVLAMLPIPECVACEAPRPGGRDVVAYLHASSKTQWNNRVSGNDVAAKTERDYKFSAKFVELRARQC